MKYNIIENLCKIETILIDVYNDECSINEGSLTVTDLCDIFKLINQIRNFLEEK